MASVIARARIEGMVSSLPPKVKKFLTSHIRKGENLELKTELNSEYRDRRKDAVKRVIANMTVGKDVSGLFADVLKCMQTDDLELKKLVYLYLMNYAKTQPELVILAVNSFVKDADDPNPLIRALAVRTMGCLRADRIVDYLMEPLRKTLKDTDPYVRKTAAICVAKMYDLKPQSTIDNGFVASLQDLLSDPNPMVVANAVAALREIQDNPRTKSPVLVVNTVVLHKLLAALNECTEWGQIFILESLADYAPNDVHEARNVIERVVPRLSHANGSVVLAAIRVLLTYLDYLGNAEGADQVAAMVVKKMSPPLVTLLASTPEMTYVALRNISIILQRRPDVLANEIRVFFCKYNDPPYVKLEKLDVMMRLTSERNVDAVLTELKEYANEVDVEFVRTAIRAMGTCAIKIEAAAERCVGALLDLIKTRVAHVVQESMVVLKDIFRRYPGRYEGIIPILCEHLDVLDEEEARAALLWIVGEHADRIANAGDLLQVFVDGFADEHVAVQLQLLTAAIKCFLRRPETQPLVQQVLQLATASDLPDLRDRAFVYWRLLSSGAAVRDVVAACPPIEYEPAHQLSPGLLSELVRHLGTLAAVKQQPVATVVPAKELIARGDDDDEDDEVQITPSATAGPNGASLPSPVPARANVGAAASPAPASIPNLLDLDFDAPAPPSASASAAAAPTSLLDLLGSSPPKSASATSAPVNDDLMGVLGLGMPSSSSTTIASAPRAIPTSTSSTSNPLDALAGLGDLLGPTTSATSPMSGAAGLATAAAAAAAGSFAPAASTSSKPVLLARDAGKGLEIRGQFTGPSATSGALELDFTNHTSSPLSDFAIQFNKSTLGLNPAAALSAVMSTATVAPGATASARLPLASGVAGMTQTTVPPDMVQVAVKTTAGIVYFVASVPQGWMAAVGGAGSPAVGNAGAGSTSVGGGLDGLLL
ncbi:AP-1 complex subunit beta-1 [Allomyces arbusculus]|nr:AP-1 complex subunit beta-1 [Allomyces arbusculus]